MDRRWRPFPVIRPWTHHVRGESSCPPHPWRSCGHAVPQRTYPDSLLTDRAEQLGALLVNGEGVDDVAALHVEELHVWDPESAPGMAGWSAAEHRIAADPCRSRHAPEIQSGMDAAWTNTAAAAPGARNIPSGRDGGAGGIAYVMCAHRESVVRFIAPPFSGHRMHSCSTRRLLVPLRMEKQHISQYHGWSPAGISRAPAP
jgi:hypothetical protein